jgi:hypothetical protein
MKRSGDKRKFPPLWVIFSSVAFLLLIWTALRLIYAMWIMGPP